MVCLESWMIDFPVNFPGDGKDFSTLILDVPDKTLSGGEGCLMVGGVSGSYTGTPVSDILK